MREYFLPLIYTLISGIAGTVIFNKRKFGTALPLAIMFHTTVIIILALVFHDLRYGLVVGIVLFILTIAYDIIQNKNIMSIVTKIMSFDTLLYILIYSILFIANKYQMYSDWDEFSHWGPMIKEMYRINDFYFASDRIFAHKDYVPFVTIIEYIICKCAGVYRESLVYQAVQVFMISMFMPLLGQIECFIKSRAKIMFEILSIITAITSLVLLQNSFSVFHSIYTDLPFGLVCGFGIAHVLFVKVQQEYGTTNNITCEVNPLEWMVIMTSIIMTKMMGIIFLPVIVFMSIIVLFDKKSLLSMIKIQLFQTIFPLIIFATYKYESKLYLDISGEQSFDGALNGIVVLITKGFTMDYQKDVLEKYISFVTVGYSLIASRGTYLVLILLVVLLLTLLYLMLCAVLKNEVFIKKTKKVSITEISLLIKKDSLISNSVFYNTRKQIRLTILSIVLIGIYYALWMYILYQVCFSEYEAVGLASFNRYMGSYIASIILLSVYIINYFGILCYVRNGRNDNNIINRNIIYIIGIFITCAIVWYDNASGKIQKEYLEYVNQDNDFEVYNNVASNISEKVKENDESIILIQQNANGNEYIRYNYALLDKFKNVSWKSIRKTETEKYEGDIWSVIFTEKELLDNFSQYDYIYIDMIDQFFIDDFGYIFDQVPEVGNLYKVDIDEKNSIDIKLIDNVLK